MAFYTEAPDGLHVLDLETGVRRRLARGGGSARDDSRPPPPSWSPDGRRIAFVRRRGFRSQGVYIVGADGGDPVPLPAARNGHDAFWAAVP